MICEKCQRVTSAKTRNGRYGRFLHVKCFDAWWRSQYGEVDAGGPYYRWMRQRMCAR